MHDFRRLTTELVKEIMKGIVDMAKKVGGEGFQDVDLGEIQELTDNYPRGIPRR